MASIKIVANKAIIASTLSLTDIKVCEARRPEALVIRGPEKEVEFQVVTGSCSSIGKFGISFAEQDMITGKAFVEFSIPASAENPRTFVVSKVGTAIFKLTEVEKAVAVALAEIKAEDDSVAQLIQVEE